jgi:DNA-3-methyladenine glycosylase I
MSDFDDDIFIALDGTRRCIWCGDDERYQAYHDHEWGQPVGEDRALFEKFCLEGFQAGLSWLTILRKREEFRRAFAGFEIDRVARFDAADVKRLMADAGIVRNRLKIEAAIHNARRTLEIIDEFGSLAAFVWQYEPETSERPLRVTRASIPKTTPSSTRMAKEMKKRGFKFIGPVMAYAFMQAMGMVNDHVADCDFRQRIEDARDEFERPSL